MYTVKRIDKQFPLHNSLYKMIGFSCIDQCPPDKRTKMLKRVGDNKIRRKKRKYHGESESALLDFLTSVKLYEKMHKHASRV